MNGTDGQTKVTVNKREPKLGDIVRVDWLDIKEYAYPEYGECPIEELPLAVGVSFGEFLYMDSEKLVIARETIADEVDRQVFPKGCITDITVLEPVDSYSLTVSGDYTAHFVGEDD